MTARKLWTPDELAQLATLYPDQTAAAVGKLLGRLPGSVFAKASQLGLKKSAAFLASDKTGRIQRGKRDPAMTATQFKTGSIPWNKGTHYDGGGRSHETRFKAGQFPHTWLPIGSYRLCEGQLQRKTSNTPGANNLRWTPVTRLVWESAHGPVPEGLMVVFKPGMKTSVLEQITLDRLDCIDRAENARRNHSRNVSPEYARLTQLRGAITRQVNRITREAQEAGKQTEP